jgi:hypothetical protein
MKANRVSSRTLGAILCGTLALWVSAGALAFAGVDAGAPRIGVLPSPWWLVVALGIAGLALLILRATRQSPTALWLAALLLLPWLPVSVPAAVFVWAGPLRLWLFALIALAIVAPPVVTAVRSGRFVALTEPRRAPRVAAVLAASIYLLTAWQIAPQIPDGDEPHYLVIAESLLRDGDIKIENNHLRGDYHDFFFGSLEPDYRRRGTNGEIYSIHAPGLPAIVAPVFAVFGFSGVIVFLALVTACATGLVWAIVWRVTHDVGASWFGWATVALSVPFVFQSFSVYPDGLGAAFVIFGVFVAIRGRDASARLLAAAGVVLAALPWLHTRFALTAAAIGLIIVARQSDAPDRMRRIMSFAAVPMAGAVAWFSFFYAVYGTPNPAAPYNGSTETAPGNVPRGVVGLLFDQQFGLLPNAPVYLCAFAGFVPLARRHRRLAAELAFVIVPYTLAAAAFYMWWGGFSSPARFISSVLLPLSIPAGVWYATRGVAGRVIAIGALALSVLLTITTAAVDRGALLYNVRDGFSRLLVWLVPVVDVTTAVPSLFQTGPVQATVGALVWLLAIAVTAGAATLLARRRMSTEAVAVGTGFAAALAGMLALTIVWRLNGVTPFTQGKAGPALLRALDSDSRQVALRYPPLSRLRAAEIPPMLPLLAPAPALGRADTPLAFVSNPPAATYTVEATITGDGGPLTAGIDLLPAPMWTWDVSGVRGPWRQTVTLVNDAHMLRVDGDEATRHGIENLTIRAERRLASHERVTDRLAWRAARYGPATLFLLDGRAYIETGGSWIAGGASAEFAVVRDQGARIQLFVRNAPIDNTVILEAGSWRESLSLKPREERLLDITIEPGRPGVVLRVKASTGARPADVEEGNQDKRLLGCWIETR